MKRLHCNFPGQSSYYGGRSRLPIEVVVKPVLGHTTVFSLPQVCLLSGLTGNDLKGGDALNWRSTYEMVEKQWDRSVERFFADAAKIGVTKATAAATTRGLPSVVIGWSIIEPESPRHGRRHWSICSDLDLTIGVLSRCVYDIFIAAREPNFNWDTLFGHAFEVDEEMVPCIDSSLEPQNRLG